MIGMLVRIFGGMLLAGFIAWILYIIFLGLKVFFTPRSKKSSKAS